MMMIKIRKLTSTFLLLLFLTIIIITSLPVQNTSAIIAKSNDTMCIPPVAEITSNPGHFKPTDNWITLEFLSRDTIRVSFNVDGKKCQSPNGLPMTNISTTDTVGLTKELLDTIIRDRDTTDSTWEYVQYGAGNSRKDDSRLDNFENGKALRDLTKDNFGGNTKIVSVTDLRKALATTEYYPSFDNALVKDNVANCRKNGDSNDNFVLRVLDKKYSWTCEGSLQTTWTGLNVLERYSSLENFNITYAVLDSDGQTSIVPINLLTFDATASKTGVFTKKAYLDTRSKNTFVECPTGKFINDGCKGNLSIDTSSTYLADNADNVLKFTITRTDGVKNQVMVAGVNTLSAQSASSVSLSSAINSGSCEASGGAFSFIICPALTMANKAVTWLDGQIMNQLVVNEEFYARGTDGGDKLALVWARIRNISYILLLVVVLIMVIGTAIESSFIDAYTVKRAMPRLLVAVVFIALSLDITRILVTITNAVGIGISGIIAQPFGGFDSLSLQGIFHPGLGSVALGGGMLAGLGLISKLGSFSFSIIFLFIGSASLALLAIFVLLAVRDMLIIFLMILGPIAILFWIFPGHNKVWKMWWNSFYKLLLLFPVIIALLITGRGFASIINISDDTGITVTLMKITAFIAPYFFILPAFKMAGGAFAGLADMVDTRRKGLSGVLKKKRQQKYAEGRKRIHKKVVRERSRLYEGIQKQGYTEGRSPFMKRFDKRLAKMIGGRDIYAEQSKEQADSSKDIEEKVSTGRDDLVRGASVDKVVADLEEQPGNLWRMKDGIKEYKTLGGGWVSEASVDEGHKLYDGDIFAQQAILAFEIRKAMETGQVEGVSERYASLAEGTGGWGMTAGQSQGAMIGAGFQMQDQSLEFKYMKRGVDDDGTVTYKLDATGFAKEMYEKRGSYAISQMSGNTINRLEEAFLEGNEETKEMVKSIANTFVQRGMAGGTGAVTNVGEGGVPVYTPPQQQSGTATAGATGAGAGVVYSSGSGSVSEKVAHLAIVTGVLEAEPDGTFSDRKPGSTHSGR